MTSPAHQDKRKAGEKAQLLYRVLLGPHAKCHPGDPPPALATATGQSHLCQDKKGTSRRLLSPHHSFTAKGAGWPQEPFTAWKKDTFQMRSHDIKHIWVVFHVAGKATPAGPLTSLLTVESRCIMRSRWESRLAPEEHLARAAACDSFSLCLTMASQPSHSAMVCA